MIFWFLWVAVGVVGWMLFRAAWYLTDYIEKDEKQKDYPSLYGGSAYTFATALDHFCEVTAFEIVMLFISVVLAPVSLFAAAFMSALALACGLYHLWRKLDIKIEWDTVLFRICGRKRS